MHFRKYEGGIANIELSLDELLIVNNALNEVCNGLDLEEFATRVGVQRDDALWLLRQVRDVIQAVEDRTDPDG